MPEEDTRSPAIAILVSDYLPSRGGTTTQARLHALEFRRQGWDVTVLTRRVRHRLGSERLDDIEVRRIALPGRGRVAKAVDVVLCWLWLARRRRTLDAVSVMMDADFAIASLAAGLGGATVLTWVTRGDATRLLKGRLGQVRLRLLGGCSQVVLTPRMEGELHELGVSDVAVIPVPVDTSRFHPPTDEERAGARHELRIPDGPVVLFVGHLQERKGVDLLLQAFRTVLDHDPNAQLVIVGAPVETADRAYVARLERIVDQIDLGGSVTFAGGQDDVTPYLFAADLFCLPSHREGMPNVLLEAMACGLACVAPASAGGDELLYRSAGVVPPSNAPSDLAEALVGLLDDPDRRRALGEEAASRVRVGHEPEQVVGAYERIW